MLSEEDVAILRFIDAKVVVYPHEVADHIWPDDENRNLKMGSRIKSLESDGWCVRRGDKKGYVIATKKAEKYLEKIDADKKAEEFNVFE